MTTEPGNRIPILTIGGHLGVGKTTFVNHLLAGAGGRRIVVFVNDFGAINIDVALIDTVVEDRVSLTNGCVCCTLSEDLVAGIAEFAGADEPPDAIAIEMSGVADPRALDASLGTLEAAGLTRLDTRLYIVDCEGFVSLDFGDRELAIDSAAASDLVLLNKLDLVSDDAVHEIESVMEESCPFSTCVRTRKCDLDLDLVFAPRAPRPRGEKDASGPAGPPGHHRTYATWSGRADRLLNRADFEHFASWLSEFCIRAKGIACFTDAPGSAYAFHLVGRRATLERISHSSGEPRTELVAIGLPGSFREGDVEETFRALG